MKKAFVNLSFFAFALLFLPFQSFAVNEICPDEDPYTCCKPPQAIQDGGGCPSLPTQTVWIGDAFSGSCKVPVNCPVAAGNRFLCATDFCYNDLIPGPSCSTSNVDIGSAVACCPDNYVAKRNATGWECAALNGDIIDDDLTISSSGHINGGAFKSGIILKERIATDLIIDLDGEVDARALSITQKLSDNQVSDTITVGSTGEVKIGALPLAVPIVDGADDKIATSDAIYDFVIDLSYITDDTFVPKNHLVATGVLGFDDISFVWGDADVDDDISINSTALVGTFTNAQINQDLTIDSTGDVDIGAINNIADNEWLGLGSSAGRIQWDDRGTDEVIILDANVGVGTDAPSYLLDVAGVINTNKGINGSTFLRANAIQAAYYDSNYFRWGDGGIYNYFSDPITIGNAPTINPGTNKRLYIYNDQNVAGTLYGIDTYVRNTNAGATSAYGLYTNADNTGAGSAHGVYATTGTTTLGTGVYAEGEAVGVHAVSISGGTGLAFLASNQQTDGLAARFQCIGTACTSALFLNGDAGGPALNDGYVIVGDPTGNHVSIDNTGIFAKSDATTMGTLQLGEGADLVLGNTGDVSSAGGVLTMTGTTFYASNSDIIVNTAGVCVGNQSNGWDCAVRDAVDGNLDAPDGSICIGSNGTCNNISGDGNLYIHDGNICLGIDDVPCFNPDPSSDGNIYISNGGLCVGNNNDCPVAGPGVIRYDTRYRFYAYDLAEFYYTTHRLDTGIVVRAVEGELLVTSTQKPYDSHVIGIVSTSPNIVFGTEEDMTYSALGGVDSPVEDGRAAIGIAGRVPVKVTNENGFIEIGDLLTSSSKPGYAMKWSLLDLSEARDFEEFKSMLAENDKRRHAIVGKAIDSLKTAEGEIVAVITLQ